MSSRSGAGLPIAHQERQKKPSTYQTGTFLLRKLMEPIVIITLVGVVIGFYGITGITTGFRYLKQIQHNMEAELKKAHNYTPVVKEVCAPQIAALERCFPSYAAKKRIRRCKKHYKAVAECRKTVEHAQVVCKESDPDISEPAEIQCVNNLVHGNA